MGSDAFETAKNYHYDDQIDISNRLSREQYNIMVKGYTELPFSSEYVKNDKEGIYVDAAMGEPLFSSYDKFYSKSGWPSFTKPISDTAISEKTFNPFGTTAVTRRLWRSALLHKWSGTEIHSFRGYGKRRI